MAAVPQANSEVPGLDQIRQRLTGVLEVLRSRYPINELGIFGSFARNQMDGTSDLDLLVSFSGPIGFFDFMELESDLCRATGLKVDLVDRRALKTRIGERILREVVYL